jgi:hypothetical protein
MLPSWTSWTSLLVFVLAAILSATLLALFLQVVFTANLVVGITNVGSIQPDALRASFLFAGLGGVDARHAHAARIYIAYNTHEVINSFAMECGGSGSIGIPPAAGTAGAAGAAPDSVNTG